MWPSPPPASPPPRVPPLHGRRPRLGGANTPTAALAQSLPAPTSGPGGQRVVAVNGSGGGARQEAAPVNRKGQWQQQRRQQQQWQQGRTTPPPPSSLPCPPSSTETNSVIQSISDLSLRPTPAKRVRFGPEVTAAVAEGDPPRPLLAEEEIRPRKVPWKLRRKWVESGQANSPA